jgi:ElaA protein
MTIRWILKQFRELTPDELYAIMRLRIEVFVVEQNCVFQDLDNKDQKCMHFMGWQDDLLGAYTRIVPPGVAYDQPAIGRVVTSPSLRGSGIGRTLMEKSIEKTNLLYGNTEIKVGAQLYLKKFYTSLGFVQSSGIYLEDGIEHIEMIKPA